MEATQHCKNCHQIIEENYCQHCGQKTSVDSITFRDTIQDFIDSIASVNAPLLKTLKLLIVNPGRLFREFIDGKRKSYYKPVPFFILATLVYLVIRELINFDPFVNSPMTIEDDSQGQLLVETRNFFLMHVDKFLFVLTFTLAGILKLFFFKKYSFAEFIAVAFYLTGVYTIFAILNMFYIHFANGTFQLSAILAMFIYVVYATTSFFRKRKFIVALKSVIIYLLAILSYVFLSFAISYVIIWIKNN